MKPTVALALTISYAHLTAADAHIYGTVIADRDDAAASRHLSVLTERHVATIAAALVDPDLTAFLTAVSQARDGADRSRDRQSAAEDAE